LNQTWISEVKLLDIDYNLIEDFGVIQDKQLIGNYSMIKFTKYIIRVTVTVPDNLDFRNYTLRYLFVGHKDRTDPDGTGGTYDHSIGRTVNLVMAQPNPEPETVDQDTDANTDYLLEIIALFIIAVVVLMFYLNVQRSKHEGMLVKERKLKKRKVKKSGKKNNLGSDNTDVDNDADSPGD
jgi:hypothetical protein